MGADRQTSIDCRTGPLRMPFVFEQPNLDNAAESHLYFDSGGFTHADVLLEAHRLRVERGDYSIAQVHLSDAIERLVGRSRASPSDDRSPKDPLPLAHAGRRLKERREDPWPPTR